MRFDVEDKHCYVEYCGTVWQVMGMDHTPDFKGFARLEHRFGPQPPSPVVDLFSDDMSRMHGLSEMEVIAWAARE